MVARRKDDSNVTSIESKRRPPAKTPEDRENQLIMMAYDEAEKQIMEGRASSQLLTHFVKGGSKRERMEQERLDADIVILKAKKEMMETAKRIESVYEEALAAMRTYQGAAEAIPEGIHVSD